MIRQVQMRSSLAQFCFAILASYVAGFGVDPASAQGAEIAKTDFSIASVDPGINLFLRQKMAAGNSKFTDDNIVLFLHGATSPSSCDFDLAYKDYSWADWSGESAAMSSYIGRLSQPYGGSTCEAAMDEPASKNQPLTRSYLALRDVEAMVDWIKAKRGVKQVTGDRLSWGVDDGGLCSLHSENVHEVVLYAPLYNLTTTPILPAAACKTSGSPLEFNFALGRHRLASEAAGTQPAGMARSPTDNKGRVPRSALPAEFWKACLATDP